MGPAASLGAEPAGAWKESWRPGIALGQSHHLQERAIRNLTLVLSPRGSGEAGKEQVGCRGPWDPGKEDRSSLHTHLHVVHHHLISEVAAILGLIHFLVKEGLRSRKGKMGLKQGGCETSECPGVGQRGKTESPFLSRAGPSNPSPE